MVALLATSMILASCCIACGYVIWPEIAAAIAYLSQAQRSVFTQPISEWGEDNCGSGYSHLLHAISHRLSGNHPSFFFPSPTGMALN